jgi:hypothetical protein
LEVFFESNDCSGIPYAKGPFPLIFDFSPTPIEGFYKVDFSSKKTFTPVALPLKFEVRTRAVVIRLN